MTSPGSPARRVVLAAPLVAALLCACSSSSTAPTPMAALRSPAISPDSVRLAFVVEAGAGAPATGPGLYLMDLGSGNATLLSAKGNWPTWAPGGQLVAYANPELTITNVLTLATVALGSFVAEMPDWSPDGTLIAYCTGQGDPHGFRSISIMQSDGTHPTDISAHGTGEWLWPSWSPNNRWLVHTRVAPGANVAQIYVMTAFGDSARQLSHSGAHEEQPTWSPDSQYVAFTRVTSGNFGVWVMHADGSGAQFVVAGRDPSWLPHAHSLLYSLGSSESVGALGLIDIDGTNARRVMPRFVAATTGRAAAR